MKKILAVLLHLVFAMAVFGQVPTTEHTGLLLPIPNVTPNWGVMLNQNFQNIDNRLPLNGVGAPSISCGAANAGQIYTDISADITWACSNSGASWAWAATGGAGGVPGGLNQQVQFNDGATFGGDPGLTYDKTTETLKVGSTPGSEIFHVDGNGNAAAQGSVSAGGAVCPNGQLCLPAATGGGTTALSAPNSTTGNLQITWTLPAADAIGYFYSNGAGVLSITRPIMTWSFNSVSSTTSAARTAASRTQDTTMEIVKIQCFAVTTAAGCTTNPVLSLRDETTLTLLASCTFANGGPQSFLGSVLSASVPAGHEVAPRITTAGSGCTTNASGINVVVQYQ